MTVTYRTPTWAGAWWTSGVTVTYGIHMGRCLVADKRGDCYLQDTDRISDDRLEPDN